MLDHPYYHDEPLEEFLQDFDLQTCPEIVLWEAWYGRELDAELLEITRRVLELAA